MDSDPQELGATVDAAIAVDLGGTNMRAALVTRSGAIRHLVAAPTLAEEGPTSVIDRLVALIQRVAAAEHVPASVPVGVAIPGPLNPTTGVVYFGPNLPGWRDVPLRDLLMARLGRLVIVGNDANCAALGEAMFGTERDVRHLIYIALGTGVGGGIIANGQLIEGVGGLGGEIGHVSVDPHGPRCTCGGLGCIEAYAGGWAIAREGRLLVRSQRSSLIVELAGSAPVTAEVVADAAEAGDAEAKAVFNRAGLALAVGLGGLINVFNPEMLVIGGGLAQAGELIFDPFREALPRYTMRPIYPDVTITRSTLGQHTGIYGAAARVFSTPGA